MKLKLPAEELEFFREQGRIGGTIGGRIAARIMTAEERKERGRKAGIASGRARRKAAELRKRRRQPMPEPNPTRKLKHQTFDRNARRIENLAERLEEIVDQLGREFLATDERHNKLLTALGELVSALAHVIVVVPTLPNRAATSRRQGRFRALGPE
jgi:hypothetical protein